MKPYLIIGLGNPLMGDDGIGIHLARLLSNTLLREDTETVAEGSDVLRYDSLCTGRRAIVLIDAVLDDQPPGAVTLVTNPESIQQNLAHAHALSLPEGIALLQLADPELKRVPMTLLLVSVPRVQCSEELSSVLRERFSEIVDQVGRNIPWVTVT